ncbi:hypothetical protein LCAM36_1776 [Lacticaseibacillus paracasei]|nr:hypothetical protein LCAM36_1776 [Lacticaseibacillus paracasei]
MGAEYRQRYEDHLLRITVLAATHQITVVFAAMAADQWAAAGITKKEQCRPPQRALRCLFSN